MGLDGVSEKGGHWQKGSKVHVLTVRDGRRGGFCQMACEGGLSEVRVEGRDLSWIGEVSRRGEGTKTGRSGEARRNGGVWEEITSWRTLKRRSGYLTGRVLAAILWRWRRTGPEALNGTRRTGPSKLVIAAMAVHPLVHYGGD